MPRKKLEDVALERNASNLLSLLVPEAERSRQGIRETPARVCKAWRSWTDGYGKDVAEVFKAFEDGAERYDQMVWEKGIPFHSHCEHHLAPFFGTVLIAYIPDKRIVGLSKLSRLVDIFAHRLQVQERITQQIADAMMEHLKPKGVGVHVMARHFCMESRGIRRQGIETGTTCLRGEIYEDAQARAEFLRLIQP